MIVSAPLPPTTPNHHLKRTADETDGATKYSHVLEVRRDAVT